MSLLRFKTFAVGTVFGVLACSSAVSILSGCGRTQYSVGQFQTYVTRFENESRAHGHPVEIRDLVIEFGDLPLTKNGTCRTSAIQTPLITINRQLWQNMDESRREALIFHEIGHCILGRPHDDTEINEGGHSRPESVMSTYLLDSHTYQSNRSAYIQELFTGNTAIARGSQLTDPADREEGIAAGGSQFRSREDRTTSPIDTSRQAATANFEQTPEQIHETSCQ